MQFNELSSPEIATQLKSSLAQGLTNEEAARRLKEYGLNRLPEHKAPSLFIIFLHQFQNPLIYILLFAAAIIFFLGVPSDAFIISGVLIFNACIGTIQEGRTQNLLGSLQKLMGGSAVIVREGKKSIVKDSEIVPGDVVELREGDRVPADIHLFSCQNLQIDEAILTGESQPVRKEVASEQNMAFSGTHVLTGMGLGMVIATGSQTEIGKIHREIAGISTEIPLKEELEDLSYKILWVILGLCACLFVVGMMSGRPFCDLLSMLTALFICVVPEGLPVVLTLVLVTGAYRMAKSNVLVKQLQGVDTLGRTDVVFIDKTGTLTRNELMVHKLYIPSAGVFCTVTGNGYFARGEILCEKNANMPKEVIAKIGIASSLLGSAVIHFEKETNSFSIEGDPINAALQIFGRKFARAYPDPSIHFAARNTQDERDEAKRIEGRNIHDEQHHSDITYQLIAEIPFDPVLGYHAGWFAHGNELVCFAIGSPEKIMACGDHSFDPAPLNQLLNEGLRVVSCAFKTAPESMRAEIMADPKRYIQQLQLLGFIGMQDTIRPDVRGMIEQARTAGIRVIMATGDHEKTALYVARQVGLYREGDEIVTGAEIDQLSEAELVRGIEHVTVYARVTPLQKLRLVQTWQKLGKVVAMTGDGVNDAPSLVAADVGLAMGMIGTDVAKEAADIVLLDDSFANVMNAIKQGRHIIYSLRRVILYFFATNAGEVLVVLFALMLNKPLPILAAQILWLNLVTDGFLDIALAMEPQEADLLQQPRKRFTLIDRNLVIKMLYMALPMGIGSMIVFEMYADDLAKARTMTLVTMAMYQWFNAWNCRSERKSIFEIGWFSNRWFLAASALVGLLQVLVVYMPLLRNIFHTVPITVEDFGFILLITCPLLIIEEIRKLLVRKFQA